MPFLFAIANTDAGTVEASPVAARAPAVLPKKDLLFMIIDLWCKCIKLWHKHDVAGKQFPADSLKQYVGTYEFDKNHHAYITLDDGQLHAEAPEGGLPKSPLLAEDANNFYLKIINARIEFVRDASGNINSLIAHYAGKSEVCKKIK